MKKVLVVLSVTLTALFTVQLRAQNNNNPGGPANIAGNLYASNFASWNVPQGNNGPLSWSYSAACSSATSGGTTFKPLIVGAPIRIVDSNPALSENVTVTSVQVAGSGCLINVTPSNPHQNFYLTTSTGGLQEAINFANGQPYVVILTPDWQRAGGNNGMIAAAKGNNNVTLLDQRTSVSVPYLWNGSTYVATPYGGGAILPSAIVFGLTGSTGRTAVLGDFVGGSAPAIWNGAPCTVGTNALLANGQCGPSGGSTIPGTIHQQIFSAGGGAATASNATLDAAGNSRTLSNDGLFNAFTAQTTPTSNNGIQNALTVTPGTTGYVVIGPDYASVEGVYGNGLCPNWRVAIGCPAPISNATALFDYRSGLYGTYNYNPNMGPGGSTWKYDRLVSNQQAQAAGTGNNFFPFLYDMELSGSGKNGFEGGGPDSWGWSQLNTEVMRRGIGSIHNDEGQLLSLGDYHVNQATFNVLRGSTDGSGEGFDVNRYDVKQGALTPMAATANATLAAGATLIQGTLVSNNPFPADGTPYIDATKGGPLFNITAVTPPSQPTAGTWTVDATLTPDNIGRTSVLVNTPTQYYGATTNETVTVTGLTSAIVNTSTVCYADPVYQESARVVSVGSFAG